MHKCKNGRRDAHSSFKKHSIHAAVALAFGPALSLQAGAQSYLNYDGSRSGDLGAAAATWVNAAEFRSDWGLGALNAQFAYALGFSGAGVKTGAVDSGYLPTHQELASRGITGVVVSGTYANDGRQLESGGDTWNAGDPFLRNPVPGSYIPGVNDNHGNHVSGTIAAAKNGLGMMGVAFASQYYISNSNGTDGSIYGSNMDYNYFHAAYGNLAAAGVRVINSSWGSPPGADDYGSVAGLVQAYARINGAGKKSWLEAAADVTRQSGVMQVFAAGNAGKANVNIRSALPYFQPELEKSWVTAAALNQNLTLASFSNRCGIAKYWCVSAPGVDINSASVAGDDKYTKSSGTSMAAPHVTGAVGVLMERYPYLGNEEIRTILLTTSKHLGSGPADQPDTDFGWGIPDLQKGMDGPGQLLGTFTAKLSAGSADTWRNSISDAAWRQRKTEEAAEIAAWAGDKAALQARVQAVPEAGAPTPDLIAGMARGRALLQEAIKSNTREFYTAARLDAALAAARSDPYGAVLLGMYEAAHPNWTGPYSTATDYANFIAGRSDTELATASVNAQRDAILAANAAARSEIEIRGARIAALQTKTDADYVGRLVKAGAGTLILTGDNSYTGGTQLQGGTLGVGSSTALGTGTLAMADATTLQAAADGLALANAITVSGIGNIDTQAFGLTLAGDIADGASPGGLAKLGTGTLTLSGRSSYSGPTGVVEGGLRAGAAGSFSPRSAFYLASAGRLELAGFDQTIGSLAGAGEVALGTGTLTTGGDGTSSAYAGRIGGSGGLVKTGAGAFELAGANSYSGDTVVAAGALRAGAANAFSAASAMRVQSGAVLDLAGHGQRIAGMTNAGLVSLQGAVPGTTLTVAGPWVGQNGVLGLGTAGADRLLLSGSTAIASGLTTVRIASVAGLGAPTLGKGVTLVGTEGGASVQGNAFVLAGEHVDAGAFQYRLHNDTSGSYLSSSTPLGLTTYRVEAPLFAALPAQLRQGNLAMLGNMRLRVGDDLRATGDAASPGGDRRAWGRVISTDLDIRVSRPVSPESEGRLNGFQAGTDLLATPNWRAGLYVGQLEGNVAVRGFAGGVAGLGAGSNDLRSQYFGLYGTYTAESGFYADAALQAGRHRYTLQPLLNAGIAGKGRSLLASLEIGQSVALGEGGWKIEPQLQLIHQRQSLDDANIVGALVQQRPDSGWIVRTGVRVSGTVATGAGSLQPYGRLNVYKALDGSDVARYLTPSAGAGIATPTGGTSTELAAGFTLALSQTTSLYGELGKLWASGGAVRAQSGINGSLGVRMRW